MNLFNIVKYFALALSLLGIVFVFVILSDFLIGIDLILVNAYIILFVIILSVLFFAVIKIIADKASLMATLKGVGSFMTLFIICILISSGDEFLMRNGETLSWFSSKLISASIIMFFLLVSIAVGYMLFFGLAKKMRFGEKRVKMGILTIPGFIVIIMIVSTLVSNFLDPKLHDPGICVCADNAMLAGTDDFDEIIQQNCANYSNSLTEEQKKERVVLTFNKCF